MSNQSIVTVNVINSSGTLELLHESIVSMTYTRSVEKDNSLDLTLRTSVRELDNEHKRIVGGSIITVQYGTVDGTKSPIIKLKIQDVKRTYSDNVTLKIVAVDLGNTMKKTPEQTVWKNKRSIEIAQEIALKYGMYGPLGAGAAFLKASKGAIQKNKISNVASAIRNNADIAGFKELVNEAQGQMSDFEFLQYLAGKEKNTIFFVDNDRLHFEQRNLAKKPIKSFIYNSNIMRFEAGISETTENADAQGTETSTFDRDSKTTKVASSENVYDQNANLISSKLVEKVADRASSNTDNITEVGLEIRKSIFSKSNTDSESIPNGEYVKSRNSNSELDKLNNLTRKRKQRHIKPHKGNDDAVYNENEKKTLDAQMDGVKASLEIPGDATLKINEIITISNVARQDAGKWYITTIKDTLVPAFKTSLALSRNSSKEDLRDSSSDVSSVNKETSEENGVKIHTYDQNGDPTNE